MREELSTEVERLSAEVAALEFQTLMSGDYDDESAILAIHAGAGGTEAQDWAQMLQRMFLRWAEQHRLSADILDESAGDEAGIKSCTIAIGGRYAFGWLKSERGVHRLVRISPYDASSRRHTSFAKVEVWPDVAEDIEIEIDEKDLRIDRFRADVYKRQRSARAAHHRASREQVFAPLNVYSDYFRGFSKSTHDAGFAGGGACSLSVGGCCLLYTSRCV